MDPDLQDFFEDEDEEIVDFLENMRTYTIRGTFSKNVVRTILNEIRNYIPNIVRRNCDIDPLTQLLITLRFYGTGDIYIVMGDFVGIHKTTAGRIIKHVTEAILHLRPNYIYLPRNQQELHKLQVNFKNVAQFPRIIGAIDCTHIKRLSPGGPQAEFFRNRKGVFSLNVQVVCDNTTKIMDIVARWPGATHDSQIF
ncbi:hypothetical protein NQ318_016328 [Aromia moschata]|uniref:DDE Tnp4 domain-containing protein n=1 Tax=Aromia moschata TaxID=1265417 RepID=A0AAV8Z4J8_9CUCU|nr:hypothetical protein NQ318_016328 [Aromia moschata]